MLYCANCGEAVSGSFCSKCGTECVPAEENSSKETIKNLYALRAGLSAISLKVDEMNMDVSSDKETLFGFCEVEEEYKDVLEEELTNFDRFVGVEEVGLEMRKEELLKSIDFYNRTVKKYNISKSDITEERVKKAKKDLNNWKKFNNLFNFVFIIIVVVEAIKFLSFTDSSGWLFLLVCVVADCLAWTCFKNLNNKHKMINLCIINVSDCEKQLSDINQKLYEIKENLEIIDAKKLTYSKATNDMYKVLQNEFSSVLDPRDWRNLDLVIFYMETGRAKNISEALIQVDAQRRADSIVEAIERSTERICYTIRTGIQEIQGTIFKCAQALSAQLAIISNQQIELQKQYSMTAQELQKALEIKSSVSSNQLVEDIHQMRLYMEKRNG